MTTLVGLLHEGKSEALEVQRIQGCSYERIWSEHKGSMNRQRWWILVIRVQLLSEETWNMCWIHSAAHSSQKNRVSKRMDRTLVKAVHTYAGLSNAYWAEEVATAVYLCNRMVTAALKSSERPYQHWCGKKPNLQHVRVFGCMVYIISQKGKERSWTKNKKKILQVTTESGMRRQLHSPWCCLQWIWFRKAKTKCLYQNARRRELELEVKTPEQSESNEEQQAHKESKVWW